MPYHSDTIATVIKRINERYFLPAIQREFVWKPEQIVQIFDSLMRGYPISSFLFWDVEPANRDKWEVYRFIENFRQYGTHNERANLAGIQQLTLVLDGQQRLTSLLIGLKGTYKIKKRYYHWDNERAWEVRSLYLNLLHEPSNSDEELENSLRYDFRFFHEAPANDSTQYWYKASNVLDYDGDEKLDQAVNSIEEALPDTTTRRQMQTMRRTLERLYRIVWKEEVITSYTEHDQNYDRVLDIFIRANSGGTELSKSDLLFSMVTARWGNGNTREEIYAFVDHINDGLGRKNKFDKDFVMKTCLVLADLPVQYLVQNFNNANLNTIYERWPAIKQTIHRGVTVINAFGLDRDTLTSTTAVIPLLYYLAQHPEINIGSTNAVVVQNLHIIRRWLMLVLLNNVFSGTSDNALRDVRRVLKEHAADAYFPADAINADLALSGRSTSFNEAAIANFLSIRYGSKEAFLALSLLADENNWGQINYHVDHIFPKSLFTETRLATANITDPQQRQRYIELANHVGNLQMLLDQENLEKSDKDFSVWLQSRDSRYKERHLIPSDSTLYGLSQFEDFISAREEMIKVRLIQIFASTPASILGG
ncbi:MAG: DUF262 domain-containing protein [Ktedonobacterales bacterium]|nr:DUF262 domain-containing protein [Ktedonobacterales bacterium]